MIPILVVTNSLGVFAAVDGEVRVRVLNKYTPDKILIWKNDNKAVISVIDSSSIFPVNISPAENYTIKIPGTQLKRRYAGSLYIDFRAGQLYIINTVPIESYVKSVVLSEMGLQLTEAMRAQAVLARTWALEHKRNDHEYDFNDLTGSQVYKGVFINTVFDEQLLAPTYGQVVTYKNEAIQVFYHAECASRSYSAYEIWGNINYPYYPRLTMPPGIQLQAASNWVRRFKRQELDGIFTEALKSNISSRYQRVLRQGQVGVRVNDTWFGVDSFRIRVNRVLGWNQIRSNHFRLTQHGEDIVIVGDGFGHMVGLCQMTAVELASLGWTYHEIIKLFYPHTKIQLYKRPG